MRIKGIIIIVSSALLLVCGCAKKTDYSSNGRYHKKNDSHPEQKNIPENIASIPNAVPKYEPKSRIGNPKKYTVFNKTYHVRDSSEGYKERGMASWYGSKFHGYHTSNGETYDMYEMTAAHKTLPLPTYLEVKNIENGRKVIVKVNDRGPFHGGRILDLSYAAAAKLDILKKGTGHIEISAINIKEHYKNKNILKEDPDDAFLPAPIAKETLSKPKVNKSLLLSDNKKNYLQLGVFSNLENAEKLQGRAKDIMKDSEVVILKIDRADNSIFKVQVGPLSSLEDSKKIKSELIAAKFPEPLNIVRVE